jgi:PiT family inorganic phosphate transporter
LGSALWSQISPQLVRTFRCGRFAFILACANGANDIANSMGTCVGAGAISLKVALFVGCTAEFAGCVLMGGEVAKTIGQGVVIQDKFDTDHDYYAIAMTAVLAGGGISTAMATMFGLPVSATHGVMSGLAAVRGPPSTPRAHIASRA